ncbi:MAG TPA: hypothetical protein VHN98_11500 [Acidimicrobiales bacterium]|nr:hypothetical protein [Acidimicrobiales bacterium]
MPARVLPLTAPLDVRGTLRGAGRAPAALVRADGVWRATHTPAGPATVVVDEVAAGVRVRSWGPGAGWALEHAEKLVGLADVTAGEFFGRVARRHPLVADLARRAPGLRVATTGAVVERLTTAVLEQKVVSADARASYRRLVWRYGSPAPGPGAAVGLRLPPRPDVLARIPSHAFRPLGVEAKRADTVRRVAANAARMEECTSLPLVEAYRCLQVLPGVGPWTAAEVAATALGDPDAVSVGDYHLPNLVAWALAGEPRADDARMLELLEPFRGHRGRVIALLEGAGLSAPRYGPRMPRARALV